MKIKFNTPVILLSSTLISTIISYLSMVFVIRYSSCGFISIGNMCGFVSGWPLAFAKNYRSKNMNTFSEHKTFFYQGTQIEFNLNFFILNTVIWYLSIIALIFLLKLIYRLYKKI